MLYSFKCAQCKEVSLEIKADSLNEAANRAQHQGFVADDGTNIKKWKWHCTECVKANDKAVQNFAVKALSLIAASEEDKTCPST